MVGDSYLRSRNEASVPSALRDHIHFLGHVPGADLPRWYATGDVFCSPATGNERFGIVLVEAMAAGRSVVCSDIPGYRTVVTPGENGVVFPPGDRGRSRRPSRRWCTTPSAAAASRRAGGRRARWSSPGRASSTASRRSTATAVTAPPRTGAAAA